LANCKLARKPARLSPLVAGKMPALPGHLIR
jgi:hypothetical protein